MPGSFKNSERGVFINLNDNDLFFLIALLFAATMYIRVELDFKRNFFRVAGHFLATVLVLLTILAYLGTIPLSTMLWWFLLSSVFILINEIIRIYLRKHSMKDILQNHPRLYWLTRGKIRVPNRN
jgi:hypothetical protein